MIHFEELIIGGDLRSIGRSDKLVRLINNQKSFDRLFENLFHSDRKIVMRTADAIEKITLKNSDFLRPHKKSVLGLCETAVNKELKWHLALLVPRLLLSQQEIGKIWQKLRKWALDKNESKIVRVNSLQGLHNLLKQSKELMTDFYLIFSELENANIPSINARIWKLKK